MNTKDIVKICKNHLDKFSNTLEGETFQLRGIFNSEALLVSALTADASVPLLLESGRARGHSTNLFAKFFKDTSSLKIISIDSDRDSEDTKYSEGYLARYNNVRLVYGDATIELENYITDPCCVFIDGPKGDQALFLAASLVKNPLVKYIFIHDLHKNTFHRNICQTIFKTTFFSDDKEFVEAFKHLDKNCWEVSKSSGDKPYIRKGKKIDSYASTMAVIQAGPNSLQEINFKNYKDYYKYVTDISLFKYIRSVVIKNSILNNIYKKYLKK